MESEIIVGLDIGTTKIACIVGTKNEFGKNEIYKEHCFESNSTEARESTVE